MFPLLITSLHIIAAMFWIGGMLFFSMVLVPCLKNGIADAVKADLISKIGKRFRKLGWISLGILLLTGSLRIFQSSLPLSRYGHALKIKLILVFLMLVLTLLHDFILGPKSLRMTRAGRGTPGTQRIVRLMARLNLLIGLLIVVAAVFLVRGF